MFSLLTGTPGSGKTLFAIDIFIKIANDEADEFKNIEYVYTNISGFKSKEERKEYDNFFELLEHKISIDYSKNNHVLDNDYQNFVQNIFNLINSKNTGYQSNNSKFYIIKSNILFK